MAASPASRLGDTLGLAHGMRAAWVGLPATLGVLTLSRRFARTELVVRGRDLTAGPFDVIHIFTMSQGVLKAEMPEARKRLAPTGSIWVSWPNPEAGLPSDMTEAVIAGLAREMQMTADTACTLDQMWSALCLALSET